MELRKESSWFALFVILAVVTGVAWMVLSEIGTAHPTMASVLVVIVWGFAVLAFLCLVGGIIRWAEEGDEEEERSVYLRNR